MFRKKVIHRKTNNAGLAPSSLFVHTSRSLTDEQIDQPLDRPTTRQIHKYREANKRCKVR